jgi:methylated-DNA-[protein]-cysteine S-methyltransferase
VSVTCVSYAAEGWGVGEVWHERARLVWHELPRPRAQSASPGTRARARGRARETPTQGGGFDPPPSRSTVAAKRARVRDRSAPDVERLVHRFRAYFDGEAVEFADVEIDDEGWTAFQRDVVSAMRRVPYGEVVSYSDLARLAGHPRAQRAAGTVCARNRFPLVVPCHRIVSADGLGSYPGLGLDYKRRMLALEGVTL